MVVPSEHKHKSKRSAAIACHTAVSHRLADWSGDSDGGGELASQSLVSVYILGTVLKF